MYRVLGVLAPVLGGGGGKTRRKDDDFIDRMSHTYTVLLLLAFAIIVMTRTYVGDPIQCWIPAYFVSAYVDYTNKICWISNTYYSPYDADLPKSDEPRHELVYYQWIPLILIAQAAFFYLPTILWITFYPKVGIDISSVIAAARVMQDAEAPDKSRNYVVYQLSRLCTHFNSRTQDGCCKMGVKGLCLNICTIFGLRSGSFLVVLYIGIKLIYLANALCQFFLMNAFLGTNYHMYGLEVIKGLVTNADWQPTPRFPRETLCDFKVRQLGNVHQYTVQCVLPINLFNEKIFIVIWFWIVLLVIASALNLVTWIWRVTLGREGTKAVRAHLRSSGKLDLMQDEDGRADVKQFATKYLKSDGLLVLRLVGENTNELVVSEIMAGLYEYYQDNLPVRHAKDIENV